MEKINLMKYDVLNDGEGTLVGLCKNRKSVLVKKSNFAHDPQKPKRSVRIPVN